MRFFFKIMEGALRNYENLGEDFPGELHAKRICAHAKNLWAILGEDKISEEDLIKQLEANGDDMKEFLVTLNKLRSYPCKNPYDEEKIISLFNESLGYIPGVIGELEEFRDYLSRKKD